MAKPTQPMERYANYVEFTRSAPDTYRLMGAYWWSVKAVLRKYGYDFGPNDDPAIRALIDKRCGSERSVMRQASKEAERNIQAGLRDGNVYLPDGQRYYLYDPDVLPHVRLD